MCPSSLFGGIADFDVGFEDTVTYVVEQLTPLYIEAARAPKGTKFINLDMEEYRDLRLTMEVFKRPALQSRAA
ncbi:hypothetical protein KbCgl_30760 [Corynebacterium glutamicum]|nr:hypothetical protein KbCgl_30760 [Corynebacterium glutamicum]